MSVNSLNLIILIKQCSKSRALGPAGPKIDLLKFGSLEIMIYQLGKSCERCIGIGHLK